MTYDFELIYLLPNESDDPAQFLDALYEAGCNDSLVGVGALGRIALVFSREADSEVAAIDSAMAQVCKAIPNAQLLEQRDF